MEHQVLQKTEEAENSEYKASGLTRGLKLGSEIHSILIG